MPIQHRKNQDSIIYGRGLLAQAFLGHELPPKTLLLAAGVSNSKLTDQSECEREFAFVEEALAAHPSHLAVYFSSCSVFDPSLASSPYVMHKKKIEKRIAAHSRFLILRLSQVLGSRTNPNTLSNFLFDKILRGEPFELWTQATRFVLDISDVVRFLLALLEDQSNHNQSWNLTGQVVPLLDLVHALEGLAGKKAIFDSKQKGIPFEVDTQASEVVQKRINLDFGGDYFQRVLEKYYS